MLKTGSLKDIQIYDTATRGPVGALHFIGHFRRVHGVIPLAFIGCLVTIVAIATDPFTQQILSYVALPTLSPSSNTELSYAHKYDFQGEGLGGVSDSLSMHNGTMCDLRNANLSLQSVSVTRV
jgi:hypothetical protein